MELKSVGWFDKKYSRGGRISPGDITQMLRETRGIIVPKRIAKQLEDQLQRGLFELEKRGGYTPSIHLQVCIKLNELAQLTDIEPAVLRGYQERYKKALEGHGDSVVFTFAHESEAC